MEINPFSTFKFPGQHYLSPLARAQRRQAYIPNNPSILEMKNILQKFLDLPKEERKDEVTKKNGSIKIKIPSSPLIQKAKIQYNETKQGRSLSPSMKVRRNRIIGIKGAMSPIVVKKVKPIKVYKTVNRVKTLSKNPAHNSNYTSYSNIYKLLVEKIPLIC